MPTVLLICDEGPLRLVDPLDEQDHVAAVARLLIVDRISGLQAVKTNRSGIVLESHCGG